MSLPAIWVRMVTVSNGMTVPSSSKVIGISPSVTGATRTDLGRRPGTAGIGALVRRGGYVFDLLPGENRRGGQGNDQRQPAEQPAAARRFAGWPGGFPGAGRRLRDGRSGPLGHLRFDGFVHLSTRSNSRMARVDRLDKSSPRVPGGASLLQYSCHSLENKGVAFRAAVGDKRPARRRGRCTDAGVAQG